MNKTIVDIYKRKSVRVFEEQEISQDIQKVLFDAALQAPTAGNMSLFSIINVTDHDLKKELSVRCDNQPFIANAPLVLIFLADLHKWYEAFLSQGESVPMEAGDLLLAMQDAMIAAQNTVVAAESLGIGSCYIGDILEHYEDNVKLLKLPKYAVPCTMVVYGYPTQQQKDRKKPPRFTIDDMVFENHYSQDINVNEVFQRKLNTSSEDVDRHIQMILKRKMNSEFKDEMNRSALSIIESWMAKDL